MSLPRRRPSHSLPPNAHTWTPNAGTTAEIMSSLAARSSPGPVPPPVAVVAPTAATTADTATHMTLTLRRAPTASTPFARPTAVKPDVHTGVVLLLVAAAGLGVFFAGLDIILQTSAALQSVPVEQSRPWVATFTIGPKTFVVGGSYILLIVVSMSLMVNRAVTVRSAVTDIPKTRLPFRKGDLPYTVYKTIQRGLMRVRLLNLEPTMDDIGQPGWVYNAQSLALPPVSAVHVQSPVQQAPAVRLLSPAHRLSSPSRPGSVQQPRLKVTRNKKRTSMISTGTTGNSMSHLQQHSAHSQNDISALVGVGSGARSAVVVTSPTATSPSSRSVSVPPQSPQRAIGATSSTTKKPVHLRRAVLRGWAAFSANLQQIYAASQETTADSTLSHSLQLLAERPPWMSVMEYVDAVAEQFGIDGALVAYFGDVYTKARFSAGEISEQEFQTFTKCLAAMTKRISGHVREG